MIQFALLLLLLVPTVAQGATRYISPSGSNAADGQSTSTPWLTFSHAFSNTSCGDTLLLMDGTYGDGTSTGKINLTKVCAQVTEYTIRALNQRQAKIFDSGGGKAVWIQNSAYIILDGLYGASTDNIAFGPTTSESGVPIQVRSSNHITVKNGLWYNPNRYSNTAATGAYFSTNITFEANEVYTFHRHCFTAWRSTNVVVRQQYCNPRGGRISGGFNSQNGLGTADSLMSMYPCKDCILENSIADGTTHAMYLNEMNATYGDNIVLSGSKILGSICYKCNYETGIYLNSRTTPDLNHTPQNITVKDVVLMDWDPNSGNGIRVSDGVGIVVEGMTVLSNPAVSNTTQHGFTTDDAPSRGTTAAQNSITLRDSVVRGVKDRGTNITGFDTWSFSNIFSNSNGTNFSPASSDPNYTNVATTDPAYGLCKGAWVPDGAPGKGAGTSGRDIGATILYRYVDGVLTTTPLWDQVTGAFPFGAADPDGINRVAGASLFDIHERMKINDGDCPFPAGYADGGGGGSDPPSNPASHHATTDLDGAHTITVASGMDSLTVFVATRYDGAGAPDYATAVTSSCGSEDIPPLRAQELTQAAAGNRSIRTFGLISPTAGSCTLTPTFSGANVSGWIMTSIVQDDVSDYGETASGTALSTTPSVTVTADADYTIHSAVATSNVPTLSVGSGQDFNTDTSHSTKTLRLGTSSHLGTDLVSNYTLGSGVYWAEQAVALIPGTPVGGSGAVVRFKQYGFYSGFGTDAGVAAIANKNTAVEMPTGAVVRLRMELEGSVATSTPFGLHIYCREGADSYTRVMDAFGSNPVRFFGAGSEQTQSSMPASLDSLTQKLNSGSYIGGQFLRNEISNLTIPALAVGERYEVEAGLVLQGAKDDVITCLPYQDNGTALASDVSPAPAITLRSPSGAMP